MCYQCSEALLTQLLCVWHVLQVFNQSIWAEPQADGENQDDRVLLAEGTVTCACISETQRRLVPFPEDVVAQRHLAL